MKTYETPHRYKLLVIAVILPALLSTLPIKAKISQLTPEQKTVSASVKNDNEPVIIANKFSIHSLILGETRHFYIHLPTGYSHNKSYPVLYIPDGKRKMQKTVALTDDLADFAQRIPKMIVIGIETNQDRRADLSTLSSSKAFLNFISQELKPYINSTYATNGESLLMGSSMGGEFVVRALFEQPEQFDGYFAISPSIYYSDFQLVEQANKLAKADKLLDKKLYLSLANEGWNQGVEELTHQLRKNPIRKLDWYFNKQEQESHGSISYGQAKLDLQHYYRSWAKPHFDNINDFEQKGGINGLKNVYSQRTTQESAAIIPISVLDHMTLLYLDAKKPEQAIALSLLAVKLHPTSGRALRNLAYVYESLMLLPQALQTYEQALTTAINNNHQARSIASHRKVLAAFKLKHFSSNI
jgi:predicted alpha/beta superfamily hydrolase